LKNIFEVINSGTSVKEKIILKFIIADYKFRNKIISVFKHLVFGRLSKEKIKNILIFRTGSLGDSICALPSIEFIRKCFTGSEIDILTTSGGHSLVSMDNLIRRDRFRKVIDYTGQSKRELMKLLKFNNYDLVIELPQAHVSLFTELRNMFAFSRADITYGEGWQISTIKYFRKFQEKHFLFENETKRLLSIISAFGDGDNRLNNEYYFNITPEVKKAVIDILDENSLLDCTFIALAVGAKRLQNRWPLKYFNEIANYLIQSGFKVIIVGTEDERSLGEQLKQPDVFNLCGKFNPLESAYLLSLCKFTISNDSGPMHLSYAVGTPVISIFSSRDFPGKWYPPMTNNNVVLRNINVPCTMCLSESTGKNICNNNICMQGIMPGDIIAEINKIL